MSNQWGGTRHGAGRKPYNPNSRDIRNMFAAAPMFPNNDNDADNNEGDNIVQPPPDGDAPPTNNNNTADSNDGPRENAQATPTTARDEHSQWSNDTWRDIPLATLEKRKKGRVLSGLLKDQVEKYKKDNKKKKARESVRNGILWSSPKYIRHGDIADLRQSWREFFTMRVFHWIPLEVMPKDWTHRWMCTRRWNDTRRRYGTRRQICACRRHGTHRWIGLTDGCALKDGMILTDGMALTYGCALTDGMILAENSFEQWETFVKWRIGGYGGTAVQALV